MADVLPAPTTDRPPSKGRPALPVIEGGLATTALTLGGLYWLAHSDSDVNPMGWYANYVIPVGAILVGLLAGSGYGIMSWLKGVKIRRGLLVTVVLLQLVAYGVAEYLAYLDVVHRATVEAEQAGDRFEAASFFEYFHYKTENFAWKAKHGNGMGEPLGHWGYFFVGLAALGFVGGGLIAPLICSGLPYCEGCERYMKRKTLGLVPASVPLRKIKKKDVEGQAAYDAEDTAVADGAQARIDNLTALAAAGDGQAFGLAATAVFGPTKATGKLPRRVKTELIHCPACARGWVRHTGLAGQGNQTQSTLLGQTEVPSEFTSAVRQATTK
ncbi:MAG TPA: hypothetical protein VF595_18235 [Tepidisphaeraceae bacterium]|jgi:hypothetical protein